MNEYDKAEGQREEHEARTEAGAEAGNLELGPEREASRDRTKR